MGITFVYLNDCNTINVFTNLTKRLLGSNKKHPQGFVGAKYYFLASSM